jgi:methylenetetrahydrofolate dehydrogenase (NADP+)/methenyltetrahydrofolate cyclohydrolase
VLYDNSSLKKRFGSFLTQKIANLNPKPELEIVLIGENLASLKYIGIKQKIGIQIGLTVNLNQFETSVLESKIEQILEEVKANSKGLIFQLPVPDNFNQFVPKTPLKSDVDLLGENSFLLWDKGFLPPTIGAIDLVLKEILDWGSDLEFQDFITQKIDLSGKTVAVIGQGILVGNPLLRYLKERHATIVSINKNTKNPKEFTKASDILICAAGSPELIDKTWVNPNTIVIDASTSESDGILVGDVKADSLFETNILCASPGGIGRITVFYLFYNLCRLGEV